MEPTEVLKIIANGFLDSHYPLRHVVLDPKTDKNYSIGDLVLDTINAAQSTNKLKSTQSHHERHVFLHKCFDELFADFICHADGKLTNTIQDIVEWSYKQTLKVDHKGNR